MLEESILKRPEAISDNNDKLADKYCTKKVNKASWTKGLYDSIEHGDYPRVSEDEMNLLLRLKHANVSHEECSSDEEYEKKVADLQNICAAYYCVRNTGIYRADKLYIFESCLCTSKFEGTTIYKPLPQSRLRSKAAGLQYSCYKFKDYYTNISLAKCESMLRTKMFSLYSFGGAGILLDQIADAINRCRPLALEGIEPRVDANSTFNKAVTYKGVAWGIDIERSSSEAERNLGKLAYIAIERSAISYALGIINLTDYIKTIEILYNIIKKLNFRISPDSTVSALIMAVKCKDCRASACTIYNMLHELCVRGTNDLNGVIKSLGSDEYRVDEKVSLEASSTFYANGYYDLPEHINVLYKKVFQK